MKWNLQLNFADGNLRKSRELLQIRLVFHSASLSPTKPKLEKKYGWSLDFIWYNFEKSLTSESLFQVSLIILIITIEAKKTKKTGKKCVIGRIVSRLWSIFVDVVVFHWITCPSVYQKLKEGVPGT